MKELVFVQNNKVVTDSLTVAEVFGKEHKHVMRDISTQIEKLNTAGETEFSRSNFGLSDYTSDRGRTYQKITLSEEAFTLVAFAYVTPEAMKMKVKFIQEFKRMRNELESKNLPSYAIDDPIERAKQWISEQTEKKKLEQQIQLDKPKVLFADAVEVSNTSILIGELSKLLKQNGIDIGQNRLFQWMRDNSYLMKKRGEMFNLPTQYSMDLGLFEIKKRVVNNPDGSIRTTRTSKVTGKGQIYFINKFLEELAVS